MADTAPVTPTAQPTADVKPDGIVTKPSDTQVKGQETTAQKERVFTINGKEWPESQLAQRIQKAEGLEGRVKQADQYEKAFNSFAERTQDPQKFLEMLSSPEFKYDEEKQEGLLKAMLGSKKPRLVQAVKQWLYENEIEPSTLTPEQRRLRELESENKQFKTKAEQEESDRKASQLAVESQKIWEDYRTKIGTGIKEEGLPETEMMVARIARKAMLMRRAGQPADIKAAILSVKSDLQTEYIANIDKASEDEILKLLPESSLRKINAAFVKSLKKPEAIEEEKVPYGTSRKPRKDVVSKENKDFWKNVGRGMFAQ